MKPQDLIIVVILIAILIPAIKSTITHMKGEGACCGGPKEKPVKKKIPGKPKKQYTVYIEGMHCDNCKNRVEKNLDKIEGVVAKVKLSRNLAKVLVYDDTPESVIKETIENLDFKVTKITEIN
ncbi:MAG: heavy-metal-associated domain-containing protein [Lachnospiraceae bacterium]|nr:heavy-metal-associated domain-containing protein [Lachnospiraceae bacterium]